jgi:uncharacterized membrane protein
MKLKTSFPFVAVIAVVAAVLCLAPLPVRAQAQVYRTVSVPSFSTIPASANTNNLAFDNATGGPLLSAIRLPKLLQDGLTMSYKFSCATVTLTSVTFVHQGSVDGTNYHNIPGSALVAHIPAGAASANNTNIVYTTNFSKTALQGWNWFRLAGGTNANPVDVTSVLVTAGYWE